MVKDNLHNNSIIKASGKSYIDRIQDASSGGKRIRSCVGRLT